MEISTIDFVQYLSGNTYSTIIHLSSMGEFLQRGVTHSRHTPRKGARVNQEASGVVIPGFLVPSKLSCLARFAQEFADASGAETHLLNDNGRGRTVRERAQRIADRLATDPQTREVQRVYLLGQSRGSSTVSSLERELRERGYDVLGAGYVTPRGIDESSGLRLAGALAYDMATTTLRTAIHPLQRRTTLLPLGHYLVNSASGVLVKTALGEIAREIGECARKNPDNNEVKAPVVVVYGAKDKIANYRKLLAEGVSHEDVERACETVLRQEFPNASRLKVVIVPGEQHDLPITKPQQIARLVFDAISH
jgi:hypothetical protein